MFRRDAPEKEVPPQPSSTDMNSRWQCCLVLDTEVITPSGEEKLEGKEYIVTWLHVEGDVYSRRNKGSQGPQDLSRDGVWQFTVAPTPEKQRLPFYPLAYVQEQPIPMAPWCSHPTWMFPSQWGRKPSTQLPGGHIARAWSWPPRTRTKYEGPKVVSGASGRHNHRAQAPYRQ